ncbi:Tyrosine--tRNA ligase 1 cytoplasmic [Zea mays]|uniref:tyrosine--tRNA ligase n=1 Tax=Zea mays TaxID=4577 RepID=A0A1D6PW94_MAIZE|nr:Tyrosine--tRNA ligase 1 cytoplasmic [Zea mays]
MDSTPAPEAAPGASSSSPAAAAAAEGLAGGVAAMTLDERFEMLRGIGEECIQEDELRRLLENKPVPICYDGFEPSGRMHIAQGVVKTINVNKMVNAGCKVKIWIADWFAQLNNKMGGDLKKIQTVGRYMIEIWKAAGMNLDGVEFLWSSEEINKRAHEYWPIVMDIARKNNVKRIMRCCQIFYPCMQCADIFFLKADICQLGMDQRKVNVLAREYCDDIKRKNKPIILSHHMLPGFKEGQEKMSKSDPSSAIFMEDDEAQVNVKIKQAFCPPKIVEGNPCLEYIKYIVFPWFGRFEVIRKESNGGNKTFTCMNELISDYETGALHPADVKPALAKAINEILQPVRDHFNNNNEAKVLLNTVKKYRVTN